MTERKKLGGVLFAGYYAEDVRTLLRVADAARATLGVRPTFLVASDEPLRGRALELIQQGGYEVIEDLPHGDSGAGSGVLNPFRRAPLVREANVRVAERILDRAGAEAIVCTLDLTYGQFLATAARRGIPSVLVQWTEVHSLEVHQAWWREEARHHDSRLPTHVRFRRRLRRALERAAGLGPRWPLAAPATYLAVPGAFYAENCRRAGVDPARVRVTGNVQCDEIAECANLGHRAIAEIRESLGLRGDRPFLLYAPEHTDRLQHLDSAVAARAHAEILRAMKQAAQEFPRVVKLHPKEEAEACASWRALDPDAVIVQGMPIGPLVAASALVISVTSSSLLWAVGIDRPAISAFLWPGMEDCRLRRHWTGVELADTPEDLERAIRENLSSEGHIAIWRARRAACREQFLRADGQSVSRIVGLLGDMLKSRSRPRVEQSL